MILGLDEWFKKDIHSRDELKTLTNGLDYYVLKMSQVCQRDRIDAKLSNLNTTNPANNIVINAGNSGNPHLKVQKSNSTQTDTVKLCEDAHSIHHADIHTNLAAPVHSSYSAPH